MDIFNSAYNPQVSGNPAGPNYAYTPFAPTVPQIPTQILGPGGAPYQYPVDPMPLDKEDRGQSMMVSWDAFLLSAFTVPTFNPDAFIVNKGYDVLDQMMNVAPYSMAIRLKKAIAMFKEPDLISPIHSRKECDNPKDYDLSREILDFCFHLINNIRYMDTKQHKSFRAVLWQQLEAIHTGFSIAEIIWRVEDRGKYAGKWLLQDIVSRRPKQIGFQLDPYSLRVLNVTNFTPVGGFAPRTVPMEKCIHYVYQPEFNLPYGKGDARVCYKHVWSIDQCLRWYGIALKRYGSPFLEGIVQNPKQRAEVSAMLAKVENGATLTHGSDLEVKTHWAPGGTLQGFESFLELQFKHILYAVLGQTLTTTVGDGTGSYSLASVHQNTQQFFTGFPRHDIEEVFTQQLLRKAVEYNFGEDAVRLTPSLYMGDWSIAEMTATAKFMETVIQNGIVNPEEKNVRKMLNLPPPGEGEEELPLAALPGRERVNIDEDPANAKRSP